MCRCPRSPLKCAWVRARVRRSIGWRRSSLAASCSRSTALISKQRRKPCVWARPNFRSRRNLSRAREKNDGNKKTGKRRGCGQDQHVKGRQGRKACQDVRKDFVQGGRLSPQDRGRTGRPVGQAEEGGLQPPLSACQRSTRKDKPRARSPPDDRTHRNGNDGAAPQGRLKDRGIQVC